MERETKFRGKRKRDGRWIYGLLHYSHGTGLWFITHSDGGWVPTYGSPDEGEETIFTEVDPNTIGEFTGLKDKNNKEIYEGDIIDCDMFYNNSTLPHRGIVIYSERYMAYATKNEAGETLFHNHDIYSIKVIGNIYDNPELIK